MAVEKMELKPDRALLDPNFDGYKLSLESMPLYTATPPGLSIKGRMPAEDQYSFLHAKLFGQSNNFLCTDPFGDGRGVYVLDPQEGKIQKVIYSAGAGTPPQLVEVWSVPAGLKPTRPGDYNPSLRFASESLAVFANGSGMIFILDTGDRGSSSVWRSVFHEEICGADRPFAVVSAVFDETALNCLLLYVEAKERVEGFDHEKHLDSAVNFVNVVEWMTFATESSGPNSSCWGLDRVRRFVFPGGIDYAQLTSTASHFVSCTTKPFFLVFDTMGGNLEDDELSGKAESKTNAAAIRPTFYYLQSVDDITLWVILPVEAHKRDIKVSLKPRELNVSYKGSAIISGRLWDILDSEDFVWTLDKGKLEINVTKCNSGLIWQRFLAHGADGDAVVTDGEEVNRPEMVEEIEKEFELKDAAQAQCKDGEDDPLPVYNSQELEACDALPEDSFAAHVFDGAAGKTVQKADLSGHQWLFNLNAAGGGAQSSVCLRHDVDGLVWEVPAPNAGGGTAATVPPLNHTGTFSALGYVQASKEHRKFSVAAPDLSYVAICDRSRHIYLYRQPTALADGCDLRNRKSGQRVKAVSKQQVITIDDGADEVQGAVATRETLFVLTTKSLVAAQISS